MVVPMDGIIIFAVVSAVILGGILWFFLQLFPTPKLAIKRGMRQAEREKRADERYARAAAELNARGWKP
jgi:hypothetical protein